MPRVTITFDAVTAALCTGAFLIGVLLMFGRGQWLFVRAAVTKYSTPTEVSPQDTDALDQKTFYSIAQTGSRINLEDNAVTLVIYNDYACGACATYSAAIDSVVARFPEHLTVRIKHFTPAPNRVYQMIQLGASCANAQGAFAQYNHAVFAHQTLIEARAGWLWLADSAGIRDRAEFVGCVRSRRFADQIRADTKEGLSIGVRATPTSFLNGRRIVGAASARYLDSLIALELDRGQPRP